MRARGGTKRRILGSRGPIKLVRRRKQNTSFSNGIVVRLLRRLLQYSRRRQFYYVGYLFYFSPFEILGNGSFVDANKQRRTIFFGLSALYAGITFYRFLALVQHLNHEGLDEAGTLCFLYWIAMFGCGCLYSGLWICQDMRSLLNHSHPQCMRQVCGWEDGSFSSLSFFFMRIMASWILAACTLLSTLFSVYSDSLAVCVYPTVKGILPHWEIPTILWQIALLPLELMSVVPPAVPAFISLYTLLIGLTQLKGYLANLRRKKISNFDDWEDVERGYKCAVVYNQIFKLWAKRVATPIVVAAGLGMIGTIYATLTSFNRLPIYIYAMLPVGAVAVLGIFIFACMEAVGSKLKADDVLGLLRERSGLYLSLSRDKRKEFILRGRTLKPIVIPIGNFTEMSMDVPVYVFEEVLDQILFLLSL